MTATAQPKQWVEGNGLGPAHYARKAPPGPEDRGREVLHASLRGMIAAAAMTGMRALTTSLGLVKATPPRAISDESGLSRIVPARRRRAATELMHWSVGAQGGAVFGLLPDRLRRRSWSGPVYGLLLWLGFEAAIAPRLGLEQATRSRAVERVALAADHALYGFVLSEMRRRPRR